MDINLLRELLLNQDNIKERTNLLYNLSRTLSEKCRLLEEEISFLENQISDLEDQYENISEKISKYESELDEKKWNYLQRRKA